MPPQLPVGPYRALQTPEGKTFPYYIIPFDKSGECEGPRTRQHLIDNASNYTDIYLFSHGWNNDWTAATERYENFINGFLQLRRERSLSVPADYRPVLVGVFWPSQALAWFESETGPDIAAADPAARDEAMRATTETIRDIAEMLPADARGRFYELAQAPQLDKAEARALASLLAGLTTPADEGARGDAPSPEDLLAAASAMEEPEPDLDEVGSVTDANETLTAAGGFLGVLDPRNLLKPFTVWQMKDRAAVVGARGVAPLLESLLTKSTARVHLIGHSYGCKVVMTAVCKPASWTRNVESALLLQAAVSLYAFASNVPERNVAGGFHMALKRVNRPVVATFSPHDTALRHLFHLAVRRHDDVGELEAAAGAPPTYGALGGFGPQASNATVLKISSPGSEYDLSGGARIIGIDGSGTIKSHGDISKPATWWMAYSLATAHMRFPQGR
jgi:hypothetical protein